MADPENVIKGLELCDYQDGMPQCDSCPYDGKDCWNRLKRDALSLLKAQEPRVMTLEEVKKADDPVFFETQSGVIYDWAIRCTANEKHVFLTIRNSTMQAYRIDRYGVSWRCWTSRPTDEQRKAVKWDAAD